MKEIIHRGRIKPHKVIKPHTSNFSLQIISDSLTIFLFVYLTQTLKEIRNKPLDQNLKIQMAWIVVCGFVFSTY
jgi:hypothetical protein